MLVCDALLNQDIFAGVGNIIKNEVLFRIRLHPRSLVGHCPRPSCASWSSRRAPTVDFLEWKKQFVLKQHWLAHTRSSCPRCHIPFLKGTLGLSRRRAFYCERCQKRYS